MAPERVILSATKSVLLCGSVDAGNSLTHTEVSFILDGIRCYVMQVMATPWTIGETMEMLQSQVQIGFFGDECSQSDQCGGQVIEL